MNILKVVLPIGYDKLINIINEYNPAFNKLGKIKIFSKTIVLWRQKKKQLVCVLIRDEV